METVSNEREGCVIAYKEVVDSWAQSDIDYTINQVLCKHAFVFAEKELFFLCDTNRKQFYFNLLRFFFIFC